MLKSCAFAFAELADSEAQAWRPGGSKHPSEAGPPTEQLQPLCWLFLPSRSGTLTMKSYMCLIVGGWVALHTLSPMQVGRECAIFMMGCECLIFEMVRFCVSLASWQISIRLAPSCQISTLSVRPCDLLCSLVSAPGCCDMAP